jgi:hypothetical protein
MTAKKGESKRQKKQQGTSNSRRPEDADSGKPGGGRGRVDVTGVMPKNIRVDPNITEGHPGYEESGDSEILPSERLAEGGGGGKEE